MLTVQDILHMSSGKLLQGDTRAIIRSVHFNSQQLGPDALFVALTGGARDGHEFILDAVQQGARAALISKHNYTPQLPEQMSLIWVANTEKAFQNIAAQYRQRLNIPIIAVTGSNGKTTTKDMTAHLLSGAKQVYKSHQNLNNHLGVPLSLLQIKQSDAVAVLELGISEPGEMEVLGRIAQPSISILTNIGEAHLEFLNSRQGIATEKGQLFNFTDPQHYILLNKDDDFTAQFAAQYRGQTYTYSTTQPAHIYATHITYSESGTFFQVHVQGQSAQMFMPMFGEYNVANVLPGIYIALQHGMTLEQVAEQLLSLKVSDMRFETVPGPQGCVLINDAYNASPSSMKKALSTLQHLYPKRQKVAVLGDMFELGDHADSFHRDIGTSLRDVPITVITIGEKARLISEACTGQHATSREQVVHMLAPYLNKEHVILFKASRSAALEEIITLITQQTA